MKEFPHSSLRDSGCPHSRRERVREVATIPTIVLFVCAAEVRLNSIAYEGSRRDTSLSSGLGRFGGGCRTLRRRLADLSHKPATQARSPQTLQDKCVRFQPAWSFRYPRS